MTPALYAACENAVHVVKADGTILRGGRATLFILSQIGFRFWAGLLLLPPFIWFVEIAYKVVAGHRDFFAGFLFTRDHSPDAPELPIQSLESPESPERLNRLESLEPLEQTEARQEPARREDV